MTYNHHYNLTYLLRATLILTQFYSWVASFQSLMQQQIFLIVQHGTTSEREKFQVILKMHTFWKNNMTKFVFTVRILFRIFNLSAEKAKKKQKRKIVFIRENRTLTTSTQIDINTNSLRYEIKNMNLLWMPFYFFVLKTFEL